MGIFGFWRPSSASALIYGASGISPCDAQPGAVQHEVDQYARFRD